MPGSLAPADEAVDPELLSLPEPPRGEHRLTLVLLLFTALVSLAVAWSMRTEAGYAFAPADARDLGDLHRADAVTFVANRYVRGHAMLGASGAVRFERPFTPGSFRVSPVSGRRDVWIEVKVPAGEEGPRYVPPTAFAGRLIRFADAGPKHRGLVSAIADVTHEAVPENAWLIVDGQEPRDARLGVGLVALCLGFAVWSMATVVRLGRRVRD